MVHEQTDHGTCSYFTFDIEPDGLAEDGAYCLPAIAQALTNVELLFQKLFGRRSDHYPNQFAPEVYPRRSRSAVSGELCFSDCCFDIRRPVTYFSSSMPATIQ